MIDVTNGVNPADLGEEMMRNALEGKVDMVVDVPDELTYTEGDLNPEEAAQNIVDVESYSWLEEGLYTSETTFTAQYQDQAKIDTNEVRDQMPDMAGPATPSLEPSIENTRTVVVTISLAVQAVGPTVSSGVGATVTPVSPKNDDNE